TGSPPWPSRRVSCARRRSSTTSASPRRTGGTPSPRTRTSPTPRRPPTSGGPSPRWPPTPTSWPRPGAPWRRGACTRSTASPTWTAPSPTSPRTGPRPSWTSTGRSATPSRTRRPPLGRGLDDQAAAFGGDARPEGDARLAEAPGDPPVVGALGQAGAGVVEAQRDRLDPGRPRAVQRDQEQQPEVVAEQGVDGVVVDEVAHVEDDRPRHAVEDVGRTPGDERRAGVQQLLRRPTDVGRGLLRHVRPPVREDEHRVAAPPQPPDALHETPRHALLQVGMGDTGAAGRGGEVRRVVRDPHDRDPDAAGLQHDVLLRLPEVRARADGPDARLGEVAEGVLKGLRAVVERVVVGERHAVHAE